MFYFLHIFSCFLLSTCHFRGPSGFYTWPANILSYLTHGTDDSEICQSSHFKFSKALHRKKVTFALPKQIFFVVVL